MAPVTNGGTDPALVDTAIPLDGDGEELIGTTIDGRYKLEATLGRGGMGLVYRASQLGLRRKVAIKILHPALAAAPDVRSRFEREALAVGKIDHANCVAVYDVGRLADGALYLAMELLEGRSLAAVLEHEGQLPPGRALHILTHILRGLAHVHAAGLIHRDMKPENIYLVRQDDDFDFAKILDFGIAKPMKGELSEDGVKLTQAGMAFGTPIYMAPEQALGNPLDGRADLYAAAVMTYEMLCGQPPFYSDDKLEVMSMHTARPVPPMRQRLIKGGKPVPSSIEKLVARGLTKKPSDRYASAEVFLAKVEEALNTPDGGQTDVNFERPSSTGSHPLVSSAGRVAFEDEVDVGPSPDGQDVTTIHRPVESIGDAIDEVLAAPPAGGKPPAARAPASAAAAPGPAAALAKQARGSSSQPTMPGPGAATLIGPPPKPVAPTPARATQRPPTGPPPLPAPVAATKPLLAASPATTAPKSPPGGVGLGIPYTDPKGNLAFAPAAAAASSAIAAAVTALPPTAALARTAKPAATGTTARPRKRWPLYAAGAGTAVVLGVVIAVATSPGSGTKAPADDATAAGHAQLLLKQGKPRDAIAYLTAHASEIAADARGQLALGRAYATTNDREPALAAYERALALDPTLETDVDLRASLAGMTTPDPQIVDLGPLARAFELWLTKTHDPKAKQQLAANAVSDSMPRRHAVVPVIDKLDLRGKIGVDWVAVYSLDLEEESPCEKRKVVVGKLRALGDKRAVAALQRALERRGKNGVFKGVKINQCLADDARAAIGDLNGK